MIGNGPPHGPGAVLRAWRMRQGRTRDWLARCILSNAVPGSPLARAFSGPTPVYDLETAIEEWEDFGSWSQSTSLIVPFLDACARCLKGTLLDYATLAFALSQGVLPGDSEDDGEDPPDGGWEEDDD